MANAIGNNGGRMFSFAQQPVLINCQFQVSNSDSAGLGIVAGSLKGQGVRNVFMHTTQTPGKGANGFLNPNPAVGFALIQLRSNYDRWLGQFGARISPVTGSAINIDASDAALTVGNPYVITSVGHGPAGAVTIQPVADVSGSLASKYFTLYDSYGNTFVIWFYVTGVGGSQPQLGNAALPGQPGLQYVQQTIASGATASAIGTALASTINLLPSGINGVFSFTASGTTTVTCTSTANVPVAGAPRDGTTSIPDSGPAVPIIFTTTSCNATAPAVYTDGSGHLYTVTANASSATTLKTSGVGTPQGSTLTKISGTGDATITFSAAVTGYATGFTFAQTVSDTNLADWQGVGLPKGLVPTVGQSFIATATGAGASTGQVKSPGISGITCVEVVGDPNTQLASAPQGVGTYTTANVGGWIMVQFLAPTNASVTTLTPTAPTNLSYVTLDFYVDFKQSPSNNGGVL